MYPSRDMNPIAIDHMRRERLKADLDFLARAEAPGRGLFARLRSFWHTAQTGPGAPAAINARPPAGTNRPVESSGQP